jgi:hypothetical protein
MDVSCKPVQDHNHFPFPLFPPLLGTKITRKAGNDDMAKVIEFYIPETFRKPVKWIPESQRGKVIEFRPQLSKSA